MQKKKKILIIDDDEAIRDSCRQVLSRKGYDVQTTANPVQGLESALTDAFDAILLDIKMPVMNGMEFLKKIKQEKNIAARVVMITGYGSIPLTVEAMRAGAFDFLTKPYSAGDLLRAVEGALREEGLHAEQHVSALIGNSDYMKELKELIRRIAYTDSTVLITGESGTGKELVARTIHNWSRRAEKPFVAVDCSSLVETLMESELFGHIKGAFSGATETRDGRFQTADSGTLFLDEISNVSLPVQAKLLRVIQEREVPRIGKSSPEKVDVRLVTATNREIRSEISAGKFREDLFYRISVIPVHVKPLREHKTDIIPIAQFYLELFTAKCGSKVRLFSEEARKSLISYQWPGNVRELRNTIERLCVLCDHAEVNSSDLFFYGQSDTAKPPVIDAFGRVTLVDVEKDHIEKALQYFHFQINKTAKFLGIDRKTLRVKMRNYGIKTDDDQL